MKVGVILLPELPWPQDRRRWVAVDELGFDAAWTYDHLAWRSLADSAWYAAVPTLTAAAVVTERIRLGTLVASPHFRHPVTFAKELMTLDTVAQGRLTVGIGAGGPGYDAQMLGQPGMTSSERADRFEEFVLLLAEVLARPRTDRAGRAYAAVGARSVPGPVQRPHPPFVLAANGPRGMRLALEHAQGWVTNGPAHQGLSAQQWWVGLARTAQQFADLAATCPPAPGFTRLVTIGEAARGIDSADGLEELIGRAGDLGFTEVALPWPRAGAPYDGPESMLVDLADRLDRVRDGH